MARRNLKIGDVVEASGLSRETVTLVVNDRAENPQLGTLQQIGRAVGLDVRVEFLPTEDLAVAQ